jgi:biotin carboxyl carrier protein
MKLLVNSGGESRELEIRNEGSRVVAEIGGKTYEIDASSPEPGVWLLKNGHRVFEAVVLPQPDAGRYKVSTASDEFDITVADPRRLRASGAAGADADGIAEIRTQMPGKVVRIIAAEGQDVESGDGIIVVEAMKMQNEMKAPKSGKIREIRCSEGDNVNAGDILVVIE